MNATQIAALNRLTVIENAIRFAYKAEEKARLEAEWKQLRATIDG